MLSHTRTFEDVKQEAETKAKRSEVENTQKAIKKLNSSMEKTTLGDISEFAALKEEMRKDKVENVVIPATEAAAVESVETAVATDSAAAVADVETAAVADSAAAVEDVETAAATDSAATVEDVVNTEVVEENPASAENVGDTEVKE